MLTARFRPEDGARFLAALTRADYERTRTTDTDGEPDLTAPPPPNPVPALIAMADTIRTVTADSPVTAPGAEVLVHIGTADEPEVVPHAHLDDGPGLDTATLAQLLCSATMRLVKHGRLGQVIEWGHARYRPTRAQVRILVLRDRCCTVPGCGRTRFLHAHHVEFWSRGGTTDLDNLILLCGEHHRALHDGCFTVTAHGEQRFTFHHPCGRKVDYAPTQTGDADDLTRRYQHIEPDAITADWSGEGLDVSFATDVLLRNWELDKRRRHKMAA